MKGLVIKEIKPGDNEELLDIVRMSRMMHEESPTWSHLTFDPDRLFHLVNQLVASEDGLVLALMGEGFVVGMLGAYVSEHWMSQDRIATDLGLYVVPQHRGGRWALRMVQVYKDWARTRGAKLIQMGVTTGIDNDRIGKLFMRLGFEPGGGLYQIRE